MQVCIDVQLTTVLVVTKQISGLKLLVGIYNI